MPVLSKLFITMPTPCSQLYYFLLYLRTLVRFFTTFFLPAAFGGGDVALRPGEAALGLGDVE